jgi:hypothetical protein
LFKEKGRKTMLLLIVNQIVKMLLILIVGFICFRLKLVDQNGNKTLSNLLLMVVNPLLAIMALQIEYKSELVQGLLIAFVLAAISHVIGIVISQLCIRKNKNENFGIERFSSMYSNCGFMGIPLVQSILGSEGVFYLTAYMTVFNLFSWTHGILLMTGKTSKKELVKSLTSPMIIASVVGLILFFARITIPTVLADAINYIASMNTPLAMLIAGISVAQTDFSKMLKKWRLYYISILKLLVMPAFVLLVLMIVKVNTLVAVTILVAAACPSAATGTAFALRFQKDYRYSSEIYAFTTILSLITIPLFIYLAEILL